MHRLRTSRAPGVERRRFDDAVDPGADLTGTVFGGSAGTASVSEPAGGTELPSAPSIPDTTTAVPRPRPRGPPGPTPEPNRRSGARQARRGSPPPWSLLVVAIGVRRVHADRGSRRGRRRRRRRRERHRPGADPRACCCSTTSGIRAPAGRRSYSGGVTQQLRGRHLPGLVRRRGSARGLRGRHRRRAGHLLGQRRRVGASDDPLGERQPPRRLRPELPGWIGRRLLLHRELLGRVVDPGARGRVTATRTVLLDSQGRQPVPIQDVNRIEITCTGSANGPARLTLAVNGTEVPVVTDDTPLPPGSVGMAVAGPDPRSPRRTGRGVRRLPGRRPVGVGRSVRLAR